MKKTIFILSLVGLSVSSCELYSPQEPQRTADRLQSESCSYFYISVCRPTEIMNNCMLVNDFLEADEEERKEPRFSSVYYNVSNNSFRISETDSIVTYGKDFSAVSTEWSVFRYGTEYNVKCCGDKQWIVSIATASEYYTWEGNLDFHSKLTLTDKNSDGLCSWSCNCTGEYKEDEDCRYTATFHSDGDFTAKWYHQYSGSYISSHMDYSGVFSCSFLIDGKETDWCTLTYEDGDIKKAVTSQD